VPITDYTIRPTATSLGRTCQYFTGTADNPFGYGLSYTTFRYSNITVDQTSITANQTLRVRARIANQGTVAGSEVPQLYVTTPFEPASAQRPIKRLEGFSKISGRWVTVSPPSRRPCDTTGERPRPPSSSTSHHWRSPRTTRRYSWPAGLVHDDDLRFAAADARNLGEVSGAAVVRQGFRATAP
jgi:hypothetical protein